MDPTIVSLLEEQRDGTYLNMAFVSVWIWELITSLAEERALLLEYRVTFPQVVYCIARASSLSCITIASVVSVKSRHQWRIITAETWEEGVGIVCDNDVAVLLGSLFVISAATNSFLMFLRVRAIFSHSRPTVIAFGLLWAATLCGASTVLFLSSNHSDWNFLTGDDGGISGLQSCSDINFSPFVISAYMSSAAYDATLFLAITCRLLFYHLYCDGSTSRLKSFFNGEGLGRISKTSKTYFPIASTWALSLS